MRSVQFVVGGAATALLASGITPAANAAEAIEPAAVPYVTSTERALGFNGWADITTAGQRLLVSNIDGKRILMLNRDGSPITTIDPQGTPASMLASPSGDTVYVALRDASAISVLDVATATEIERIPVDPCPVDLALSSGRLFYSYGCNALASGVASVDLATTATPVQTAIGDLYYAPMIEGTGDTLVVATPATSAGTLRSFATAADGSVNLLATAPGNLQLAYTKDLTLTPDGSHSLVAHGGGVTRLSLPNLTQTAALSNGAVAAAVSPDGTMLLLGDTDARSTVRLYDTSNHKMLWQRYPVSGRNAYGWTDDLRNVIDGAVAFASDGSAAYALTGNTIDPVRLLRLPLLPESSRTTLAVSGTYGRPATLTATVAGGGSGTVHFGINENEYGNGYRSLGSAPLINGKAVKTVKITEPGALEAIYSGDAVRAPSVSTPVAVKPATRVTVSMTGAKTVVRGVHKYDSYADVRVRFRLEPRLNGGELLYVKLWRFKKGKWRDQGYTKHRTDAKGRLVLALSRRVPGKLSFTGYYAGDSRHGASGGLGPDFTIAK